MSISIQKLRNCGAVSCSATKGQAAYKPVLDPDSLLIPLPEIRKEHRSKPVFPTLTPSQALFTQSLLMPDKLMRDIKASINTAKASLADGALDFSCPFFCGFSGFSASLCDLIVTLVVHAIFILKFLML